MRKSSKQTIGHAQPKVEINKSGLVVAARPTHFSHPRIKLDEQKIRNLKSVADGAYSFATTFNKLGQVWKKKEDERQTMLGTKSALTDGADNLEGYQKFTEGKPDAYSRGYMAQKGRMSSDRRAREDADFIRDHGHEFATEEQLRTYIAKRYAEDLNGLDDEDFIANYTAGANRYEGQLVDDWRKGQYIRYQEEVAGTATENLRSELARLPKDASKQDIHTTMRGMYDAMETMGGTRAAANKVAVHTIGQMAVDQGRPELMDVFEMSSASVEDPSKRIPGLANSTKFGADVQDYKDKATRARDTGKTKINQRAKYEGLEYISMLSEDGRPRAAIEHVEKMLDSGLITGEKASSLSSGIREDYEKQQYAHKQMVAFMGNGGWPPGTTMDERREAAEKAYVEVMAPAVESGDVRQIDEAKKTAIRNDSRNGVMNPPNRNLLKLTQPNADADPSQWKASHDLFELWREENPRLLYKEIGADAWNRHMLYNTMIDTSMNPETARAYVQQYDSPDIQERAADILRSRSGAMLRESLRQELGGTLQSDALIEQAAEQASVFYAITGNKDIATQLAVKSIKTSHRKVDLPDSVFGEDELWIDTRGMNYTGPGFDQAEKAFNEDQELRADLGLPEDASIFWNSNPYDRDGSVIVWRSDTMTPIMKNGKPWKIDPLTTIAEVNKETIEADMLTGEEMTDLWEQKRYKSRGRGVTKKRRNN